MDQQGSTNRPEKRLASPPRPGRPARPARQPAHPELMALVQSLTPEDKARLTTGQTAWRLYPLESISLRQVVLSDGPVGIRGTGETPGETSACLPCPSALGATWDTALAREVGRFLAFEARRHGVDVMLAPVVNLQRSPLGGRHFESLSEDPWLVGELALAWIDGAQGAGVGVCLKHYVGNEVETERTRYISRIAPEALRMVYLAPFERAVREGRVWSVMASYNAVDDAVMTAAMTAHRHLLMDVLKDEWGFEGPVVSDWTATRDTLEAALGGLDLAMPGPVSPWSDGKLLAEVMAGRLDQAAIDDKVCRLLWLAERVGALGGGDPWEPPAPRPGDEALAGLPRRLAARAMVVLQDARSALPVAEPSRVRRIALIGPNAAVPQLLGGGSNAVGLQEVVDYRDGLAAAFPEAEVGLIAGVDSRSTPPALDMDRVVDPATGAGGIGLEFLDAAGRLLGRQTVRDYTGVLREELPAGAATVHLIADVALPEPGGHWLGAATVGRHRIVVGGVEVSQSSQEVGGEVMLDSSFNVPPAFGRLVEGGPAAVRLEAWAQCVVTDEWTAHARLGLHHRRPRPSEDETIALAARAAAEADLAVVVVGTNEESESEGWDRQSLSLPGRQDDLVTSVLAARPDAIIVVNAGSPVEMPWLDRAETVLWAWFPGQSAGDALADVLTGRVEPAGRLPWTLPRALADCPVPTGLPGPDGVIDYSEGLHLGYRGWSRSGNKPARPFGFGLGWTTWRLEEFALTAQTAVGAEFEVTAVNTGPRAGRAVVQLYAQALPGAQPVHPGQPGAGDAGLDRPDLWLAGFAAAEVPAAGQARLTAVVPRRAFEVWLPGDEGAGGQWVLPRGAYRLTAASDAASPLASVDLIW
ncbi:MAG: glycoside hydrolase family 3 C-terminal domain-containing protein [Bifidobacteriaceae bacterium]|jgi:beta-glucosidase|nr:glycoside hydrolase family 3 C-terminal domain-containing protein [Bifidobacteriaceae bacterium]